MSQASTPLVRQSYFMSNHSMVKLTGMVIDPVGHGSKKGTFLKNDISPKILSRTTSFWQNFESNPDLPGSSFVLSIFFKY